MNKTVLLSFTLLTLVCAGRSSAQYSTHYDRSVKYDTLNTDEEIDYWVENLLEKIQLSIRDYIRERESDGEQSDTAAFEKIDEKEGAVTFSGNTEIDVSDTLKGDVVVKGGSITIRGIVLGDVLAINGDILIKDRGHIKGNARSINGHVKKEKGGVVEGYMEESSSSRREKNVRRISRPRLSYRFNDYWMPEEILPDNFIFRYNRVEGLFLGIGSEKKFYWDGSKKISGYGSAGYGFKIHRWRMNLGIDRQFALDGVIYEAGVEGHSLTDTKDEWIMKLSENNLTAFFWHEDYRDYFTREGFSAHIARYSKSADLSTQLKLEYVIDQYGSLSQQTDWSLFRPSDTFRKNPAVSEGTMHSLVGSAGLSTIEREGRRYNGWNIFGQTEIGGSGLKGDFNFTQAIIDIRRFQPLSEYDFVNTRLRVGSLEGAMIPQKIFEIGGANTLPAYGFKEFFGNRMILGNVEYTLSGRFLDDIAIWPSFFNLLVFADAGAATSTVSPDVSVVKGFDSFSASSIKSDIGFGIGWHDGEGRLGFAWRTDKQAPVSVFLRFNKPF